MAEETKIEWTNRTIVRDGKDYLVSGKTFNGHVGCEKVSPACANCYAERDADLRKGMVKWGGEAAGGTRRMTVDGNWRGPEKWAAAAYRDNVRPLVFTASWADVWEDWRGPILDKQGWMFVKDPTGGKAWKTAPIADFLADPQGWLAVTLRDVRRRLFRLMARTAHGLDYLVLTKRPEVAWAEWDAMLRVYRDELATQRNSTPGHELAWRFLEATGMMPNVWHGATMESQAWADKRLPYMHNVRAVRRFVSVEPMVGPVLFKGELNGMTLDHLATSMEPGSPGIHWVICGGESGDKARPQPLDWARSLRDQCVAAGVPYFYKQHGEYVEVDDAQAAAVAGPDGRIGLPVVEQNGVRYVRPGKKAAGRVLDGRTWNQIPDSALPPRLAAADLFAAV